MQTKNDGLFACPGGMCHETVAASSKIQRAKIRQHAKGTREPLESFETLRNSRCSFPFQTRRAQKASLWQRHADSPCTLRAADAEFFIVKIWR